MLIFRMHYTSYSIFCHGVPDPTVKVDIYLQGAEAETHIVIARLVLNSGFNRLKPPQSICQKGVNTNRSG